MTARLTSLRPRRLAIGVALALGATALPALAQGSSQDPPARAGRIAWLAGPVSMSPSGTDTWAQAPLNRPLVAGDRLWTDAGARDEAQFGPVIARMDAGTLLSVLAADEGATQLQVAQGRIDLHVRRVDPNSVVEIDTPNLAFVARAPGDYRIVVSPDGASTDVAVLRGGGDVYGDGNAYSIGPNQGYRFAGQDLQNLGNAPVQPYDDFDRWAFERDARLDRAQSARFVPADVVGYEDLDDNGAWRVVPDYGTVWVPTRVASNWAPYQSGHWAWIDPWGWTWVDDQPWGYAVSHYGRWVNLENRWAWVPAPARERPVFAPALVAFVGAAVALGGRGDGPGVGWFPLGPHEPYRPPYHASPAYVTRINISNTGFGRGGLDGFMNHPDRIRYANRGVPGALMAMPAAQFAGAGPAARFGRALDARVAMNAPLTLAPGARPLPQSRIGTALSRQRPPELAQRRLAVARSLPPAFARAGGPGLAHGGAGPGGRPDFGPGVTMPVRMLRPAGAVRPGVPPAHGAAGQPFGGQRSGARQFAGRTGPIQHGLAAMPAHGPDGAAPALAPAGAPYPGRGPGAGREHWAGAGAAPGAPHADAQRMAGQGAMPHGAPEREQPMHLRAPAQAEAVRTPQREAHGAPQLRPMPAERPHDAEAAHAAPRAEMHAQPQREMAQQRPQAQPHHDPAPAFQPHRDTPQPHRDAAPGFQPRHEASQHRDAPPQRQHHDTPAQQQHRDALPQQHHDAPPQQHHDAPPPPPPQPQRHDAPPPPQHHDAPPQQQHHDAPPQQQHHDAPPQHQGGGGGEHGHEHGH
ncbi:DUF6600 domain-containing protein [Massilia sp. 9096]|uniref:DUF6600 domain-containing protein n=1 Tax=Massilia sp. 9096 TaxID=1500894 RepID=UPI0005664B66|nr:DUF6600 domain-containing protein [Massilia sp. 9096]